LEGRETEDRTVDVRLILKWNVIKQDVNVRFQVLTAASMMFRVVTRQYIPEDNSEQDVNVWTGIIWLRIKSGGDSCEHEKEPSGYIKAEKFIGRLNEYQLLKKSSTLWSLSL
jgi:hypothetical protein